MEGYRVPLDHGGASGAPTQTRMHQTRDSRKGEQSVGEGPSVGRGWKASGGIVLPWQ